MGFNHPPPPSKLGVFNIPSKLRLIISELRIRWIEFKSSKKFKIKKNTQIRILPNTIHPVLFIYFIITLIH